MNSSQVNTAILATANGTVVRGTTTTLNGPGVGFGVQNFGTSLQTAPKNNENSLPALPSYSYLTEDKTTVTTLAELHKAGFVIETKRSKESGWHYLHYLHQIPFVTRASQDNGKNLCKEDWKFSISKNLLEQCKINPDSITLANYAEVLGRQLFVNGDRCEAIGLTYFTEYMKIERMERHIEIYETSTIIKEKHCKISPGYQKSQFRFLRLNNFASLMFKLTSRPDASIYKRTAPTQTEVHQTIALPPLPPPIVPNTSSSSSNSSSPVAPPAEFSVHSYTVPSKVSAADKPLATLPYSESSAHRKPRKTKQKTNLAASLLGNAASNALLPQQYASVPYFFHPYARVASISKQIETANKEDYESGMDERTDFPKSFYVFENSQQMLVTVQYSSGPSQHVTLK